MEKKFKAGDLVKREVWFKKDITEHSFKGVVFATIVGTKDKQDNVYHNLCLFINNNISISSEIEESWSGKNFGYSLVDDALKNYLSNDGRFKVDITDEIKPTKKDIQLWEKAKCNKVEGVVYDEEENV